MVLAIKEKLEADNEEKNRRPEAESAPWRIRHTNQKMENGKFLEFHSEMKRMLEALKILR